MFAICASLALLMVIFRGQIKEECILFVCHDDCFCSSKLKVSRGFFWMNDTMNIVLTLYLSMKSDSLIRLVLTQQNGNVLNPRTLVVFLGWKSNALF